MRPRLRLLSDETIGRVLEQAYRLLETRGFRLNHGPLLDRLAEAGCQVDRQSGRVRVRPEIVRRCVESAPRQIRLWDVAGKDSRDLSGDNVHFTPGSTAIKMLDGATGRMRPATTEDMLTYCRLVERLGEIDFSSTAVVPGDVPAPIADSLRLYALLKTTSKPIVTGAFTIAGFDVMRDLLLAVRGTREALKERPLAIYSCCPTSPLKWSEATADNTMKSAELGIPVEFIAMPLSGLVGPVSLLGCVVQHAAETLSGIVISQTSAPGAPVLYGGSPGIFDMRSLAATISSVEAQMINCACAEVGKRLNLPTQAYIGMSDSKALDAQAGFESGTGAYLAALAGVNSVSGPGMLYFESCQSLEKLVFDAELCGQARRLLAGMGAFDFDSDELFAELLREGTLLTAEDTLRHWRREHHLPGPVIDRTQFREGAPPAPALPARAADEVRRHLAAYAPPAVLSPEQTRDLQAVMAAAAGDFRVAF